MAEEQNIIEKPTTTSDAPPVEGKGLPGDRESTVGLLRNVNQVSLSKNQEDIIETMNLEDLKRARTGQLTEVGTHATELNSKNKTSTQPEEPEKKSPAPAAAVEIIPIADAPVSDVVDTTLKTSTFGLIDYAKVAEMAKAMPQLAEQASILHPEVGQGVSAQSLPQISKAKEPGNSPTFS